MNAPAETRKFEAEVAQVLHLVTHSLYSHKEIFLRELISNASDACDKLRFESIAKPELSSGDSELHIDVSWDPAARIVGRLVDSWMSGGRDDNRGGTGIGYFVTVMVLQLVFGLFASIIVAAFSRWREFRADAAGAQFAGRGAMISPLQRLQANHGESTLPQTMAAFGISGPLGDGFKRLFMSHPPLEERIAALQNFTAQR